MPEPLKLKEVAHLDHIKRWITLSRSGTVTDELIRSRNMLVDLLNPSFSSFVSYSQDMPPLHNYIVQMSEKHRLIELQPDLERALEDLPKDMRALNKPQQELIGFASIVLEGCNIDTQIEPTTYMNPSRLNSRMKNAVHFQTEEDWLESASFVANYHGTSYEQVCKSESIKQMERYLAPISRNVTPEHIEHLFKLFTDHVYPPSHTGSFQTPAIRSRTIPFYAPNNVDQHVWAIMDLEQNIAYELGVLIPYHPTPESKQRAMDYYLELFYNPLLEVSHQTDYFEALSMLYTLYLCLHPALDGNGTIAKALVNHFMTNKGLQPLDWDKIKSNPRKLKEGQSAVLEWIKDNRRPLQDWFKALTEPERTPFTVLEYDSIGIVRTPDGIRIYGIPKDQSLKPKDVTLLTDQDLKDPQMVQQIIEQGWLDIVELKISKESYNPLAYQRFLELLQLAGERYQEALDTTAQTGNKINPDDPHERLRLVGEYRKSAAIASGLSKDPWYVELSANVGFVWRQYLHYDPQGRLVTDVDRLHAEVDWLHEPDGITQRAIGRVNCLGR
ncbi:hypothetical protein A2334_01310 [Candidatus Roizmanbacteria bacterium RIFOXYB2_FULL_38_10]|uniref:Fido domain-containing protein n=1 Tax=Candidatus Roizmanbacteria bacterium RIFOXYD1_FULL_38_12 TaxID=1802093 RepID=A0A1F7L1M4_9BACT|nr:MAG: hypothetical protein A3K47_04605 [Candidatus Roizmanbacteria bacterium RIFOXYA2_FULL_38_14]OGK64032.1 MAG: hypothetical protein A3K27_04605 [Candidatus Roizmanbacteria bacterium RIFOXYA1_FULL_37_12]OGK65878.1 MAG: hypothetical protein A3K38_04605 [Candidatus Roizmanbacteria bacterium RIFOXYB1_FULL_40_23]OGK68984.1 MAG: hypothetical protein A2334_01310 [Candidatus Roizmanbacteria bacterium RIFOXYB2_FULL_38_10]OGK70283.1 MAG: hypothetical protein A3K21_04610 [Candidatus Roizmanbacteria ba